jgi:hypothetical protein
MKKTLLACALMLLGISLHAATVLWDEKVNGTLDGYPYAPTNLTFVVHPIGNANDDANIVRGSVTLTRTGPNFLSRDNAFSFIVPPGRILTGLSITQTNDYPGVAFGAFCIGATGPSDGSGYLGMWFADQPSGTNDVFAQLGLSSLPDGAYSMDVYPWLIDDNWTNNNGATSYSLNILTALAPPVLQITPLGNQAQLSWPTNAAGFLLQSTTNFIPPVSWATVTNLPVVIGDQMVVTNTMANGSQFFRLFKP